MLEMSLCVRLEASRVLAEHELGIFHRRTKIGRGLWELSTRVERALFERGGSVTLRLPYGRIAQGGSEFGPGVRG